MFVCTASKREIKVDNISRKLCLKNHYIFLVLLAAQKIFPCRKKIIDFNYIFVFMIKHAIVLTKTKEAYQSWHKNLVNLNRIDRCTIGTKIDDAFLSLLELIFRACFAHDKFEKLSLTSQATGKNDLLRFLLQIGWEQKILNHAIYGSLIFFLDEIGRMLGGWKKDLQEKTSTNK